MPATLVLLPDMMSAAQSECNLVGLDFEILNSVGFAKDVICKGGAAEGVGKVCIRGILVRNEAVFVAASPYMEPGKKRLHVQQRRKGRVGIRRSEQHMFCIWYVIRIVNITDRRSTIGPSGLFSLKSVNPQLESGSVAKNMMGRSKCLKCTPLVICQPFTVGYSGIRGCGLIPVA
eukprot:1154013-Pelagomonas_calceolata.AAC.5